MSRALRRRYGHARRVSISRREPGPLQKGGYLISGKGDMGRIRILTQTRDGAERVKDALKAYWEGAITSREREKAISDVFDMEAGR